MKLPLTLKGRTLVWGARTYVMAVINVTPDSFSGDGLLAGLSHSLTDAQALQATLAQARRFQQAGVDILDVGGESTRPGSAPVDAETELARVIPVIRALAGELDLWIAVDTSKAAVAAAALEAGADLVNDVWALRADPEMASVVAGHGAPVVLMHNRSNPAHAESHPRLGGSYAGAQYDDLLADVKRELLESVDRARAAGIPDQHILLDPGIGFGKTASQNLELIDRLDEICALGYPVLLGPSRKSFIGKILDLPVDQRMEGTAAAVAVGIARGADIVRVHDIEPLVRVVRMTDAIVRRQP